MTTHGTIRVGIGGWSFEPWRTTFYPPEVSKARELEYASRHVTAIEINSTFYRMMSKDVFAKWREQTPEDFVFTVKAPRSIVQRKDLRESSGMDYFIDNSVVGLGAKLGPILWQLPPSKRFSVDESELSASSCRKSMQATRCATLWKYGTRASCAMNTWPWRASTASPLFTSIRPRILLSAM